VESRRDSVVTDWISPGLLTLNPTETFISRQERYPARIAQVLQSESSTLQIRTCTILLITCGAQTQLQLLQYSTIRYSDL